MPRIESGNMHYAFNREYLNYAVNGVDDEFVSKFNTSLLHVVNDSDSSALIQAFGRQKCDELKRYGAQSFCVKVLYPGFLVGTGYPHETGMMKGEIQVGALFDYVTGAPYYPGSSVKGVLRDVFKRANESGAEAGEYRDFLKDLFPKSFDMNKLNDFEKELFDGIDPDSKQPRRIGERDVFFDAYIIGTAEVNGSILKIDNLAPHKNQPTKEPIPINMIRIAPGVCLQFNMKLTDSKLGVTAAEKLGIFKEILLTLGFGAKRNVGYGAAEDISSDKVHMRPAPKIPVTQIAEGREVSTTNKTVKQEISAAKTKESTVAKTGGSVRRASEEVLGKCPKCGNTIVMKIGKARCEGNCGIELNKYRQNQLMPSQIRDLCKGETVAFLGRKQITLTLEGYKEVKVPGEDK